MRLVCSGGPATAPCARATASRCPRMGTPGRCSTHSSSRWRTGTPRPPTLHSSAPSTRTRCSSNSSTAATYRAARRRRPTLPVRAPTRTPCLRVACSSPPPAPAPLRRALPPLRPRRLRPRRLPRRCLLPRQLLRGNRSSVRASRSYAHGRGVASAVALCAHLPHLLGLHCSAGGRLFQHVVRTEGASANDITVTILGSCTREQVEALLADPSQIETVVAQAKQQMHAAAAH